MVKQKKYISKKLVINLCLLLFCSQFVLATNKKTIAVDLCVYGGTSAGVIAAYAGKMQGLNVLLVEPGKHLGGMSTGGLGATDIGNKYAITGLGKDFYRRIGQYYNKFEQWTFEPHVASKVIQDYITEANVSVVLEKQLVAVKKNKDKISEITVENTFDPKNKETMVIAAKVFIDCTYEGDLMAQSGVSYTVGREDNSLYGETYNGVQYASHFHQLPDGIDPYIVPGDPKSGLVWGVSENTLQTNGSGDNLVQAYNFRLALTKDKDNQIPFQKPEGYDPKQFELLARIIEKEKWTSIESSFTREKIGTTEEVIHHNGGFLIKNMPNGKTDVNNFGGFSTDMIGANHAYPEASYLERRKIWKEHEDYTKGLLYFLSTDAKVPPHIREEMQSWGFCKDEFTDNGGFSNQLYVREARRMVSDFVMSQKHCEGLEFVKDGVAMAAYQMDSHNCQRLVVNGMVKNEGDIQKRVPSPFPISYFSIVPKKPECTNLIVPVCLSASHIAFGSIRMEPVFMVLGQSAAVAAQLAIKNNKPVQDIELKELQHILTTNPLLNGSQPEILVDNSDSDKVTFDKSVWQEVRGGYGINQLICNNVDKISKVKYTTSIVEDGTYEVFAYLANNAKRTSATVYEIGHGDNKTRKELRKDDIVALGLSSGEWVSLGKFSLRKGEKSTVEVSNEGADGMVTADAIIWKLEN